METKPDTSVLLAAATAHALASALSDRICVEGERAPSAADLSLYLATTFRVKLDAAERALADVLPPIRASEARERANNDRALTSDIEAWRDRMYDSADVSDMHVPNEEGGGDAWEIVRGSSRFEVREVPRYEARKVGGPGKLEAWIVWDNETNDGAEDLDASQALDLYEVDAYNEEQARKIAAWLDENAPGVSDENNPGHEPPVFIVWDTENDRDLRDPVSRREFEVDYDPTDEDSAKEAAEAANAEDYRTNNSGGWPWAQNTGYRIDDRDIDDFDAAGFVVARFDGGDLWAGIDGGGYSFTDAHWAPLYLKRAAANGWYVRTDAGLRRVVA